MFFVMIVAGMLISGRFLSSIGWKFHDLGWTDAAWLATRQTITVALLVFATMVATKDRSLSRLFTALFLSWVGCFF